VLKIISFMSKRVLVVSDNPRLVGAFIQTVREKSENLPKLTICYSARNPFFDTTGFDEFSIRPIDLKTEAEQIVTDYDIVFSIHCKQIFPKRLVNSVRCINLHPGLNPYNRGWYPQVFSIINGLPLGATLHVMDEQVDHGPIIAQKEVKVDAWDTSGSAYEKVIEAEIELMHEYLERILNDDVESKIPIGEGNYNSKADFAELCKLDLNQTDSLKVHIDRLRALSHVDFENAYFIDEKSGKKIFVKISLTPEDRQS
jgi:methionyl-tRNA formyltransferase